MTERLIACRWIVSGRVQGVGFRWSALRQARELQLAGWVRNLPDGRVEVVARGESPAVTQLEAYLARGPRGAHVESVEKAAIPLETVLDKDFNIK